MKKKIIFHAGTCKTGTTSLQVFLNKNREILRKYGFDYAQNISELNEESKKHQWIVDNLLDENEDLFFRNIEDGIAHSNMNTIIFSTEGIWNHWYDYSDKSKSFFKRLTDKYDVEIVLFLREPISLSKSMYQQLIKTQAMPKTSPHQFPYGKAWHINEALNNPWVKKHFEYNNFLIDLENYFPKKNIKIMVYKNDTIYQFLEWLGMAQEQTQNEKLNESLTNFQIEIIRLLNMVINLFNLKVEKRQKMIAKIGLWNNIKWAPQKISISHLEFFENEKILLQKNFNIHFK